MTACVPAEVTVTLRWGEGADEVLSVPGECPEGAGVWWNDLTTPDWSLRYDYAPPSAWLPGQVLLNAVEDAGAVAMRVGIQGTSLADLEARKAGLRAALNRWGLTLTLTADPVGGSPVVIGGPWKALPTVPRYDTTDPYLVEVAAAQATFSIPVQPLGA